ncbi:MAG: histidinol dehydrogenase [Nitrospiraceae bacterium]|nr:MAG: histidinol dehydrogenase [Nitrospiraceae bacterium]
MRVIRAKQAEGFFELLRKRAVASAVENDIQKTVRRIIADVRKNGDSAVRKYTAQFDSVQLRTFAVRQKEVDAVSRRVEKKYLTALKAAADRIRKFHERQKEKSWQFSNEGITVGQMIRPLERVGVYVPGGKAAYPSTVLMNVIPAQVAGVNEIALCVPTPGGALNPYVAAAIKLLKVKEVYRIGGAQAVAALAYGTQTISKVDKIVGPGNIFVAVAKRMVFGDTGIDMVAGPSEILVIADRTADASFIACDLLSQAEHDEMASSVLITDSIELAEKVKEALTVQLKGLKRKSIARKSLQKYGSIIITRDLNDAVAIANRIAPEHLEIMTKDPSRLLPGIRNAGAVFLGKWTPEPLGDYAAGPNHTLPTGGTARFSSPLGVYDFIKRTSLINATQKGFNKLAGIIESIAEVEGLEAHGNTVRCRITRK